MMESGVPITMNVEPSGCNNNNGGFGGDWGAWIILFLIFGMFGWGGFGGFGGGFGGNAAGLQGALTRADINEGFALNNLQSGINAIQQGICDSTYALTNAVNSGFNSTQMGMMQGFNGVERGFCNLSSQISDCCCQTQRAVDGEPLQSTRMIVTPAAVENFFNVSAQAYIDVPRGCCATVAVENTSTQAIQVQNANLIAVREG